jgi:hypothetical protein
MMHLGKPPYFGILGTCKGQAWGKQGLCFAGISGSARGKKGVTQSKTMEVED